jgi:hypothetical protein
LFNIPSRLTKWVDEVGMAESPTLKFNFPDVDSACNFLSDSLYDSFYLSDFMCLRLMDNGTFNAETIDGKIRPAWKKRESRINRSNYFWWTVKVFYSVSVAVGSVFLYRRHFVNSH